MHVNLGKISKHITEIKGEETAHQSGCKSVFLSSSDTQTNLTQFAYGKFKPGEKCENHSHPTMEELFYFLKGTGIYSVGNQKITLKPGLFLRIPANTNHELVNSGLEDLEFVYFGIATE